MTDKIEIRESTTAEEATNAIKTIYNNTIINLKHEGLKSDKTEN